jgi:transposase
MGNVLKVEKIQQIQTLAKLGWSIRRISRELTVDRGTVSKYRLVVQNPPKVPTDSGPPDAENPPKVPTDLGQHNLPPTQSAKIHPHRSTIYRKYLQRLSARRIYQDLVEEEGFSGGYCSVRRYVRKLKKKVKQYSERLAHPPGEEAQVDFGKSPCRVRVQEKYRKVWLFKMTLSCSKHAYEELVLSQDLETFIRCHERAFRFFNGVPEIVTLDNLKSGVLQACLYDPVLNPTYLAFATHWGFAANPCIPRKPEHKGIVERDIGYTKDNALKKRRFESLEEANRFLRHWNRRWAQTRIHGSTKKQVWQMFRDVESPLLQAMADSSFEWFEIGQRKVDVDGFIELRSRFYAVPPRYVGERVVVHHNQEWVKIYWDNRLLITHRRLHKKGMISRPGSAFPSWKHPDRESQERFYLQKARKAGPSLQSVVHELLHTDHPLSLRRVRGMMQLLKKYGPRIAETAAGEALKQRNLRYQTLKHLCSELASDESGLRSCGSSLTQEHELIRPLSIYENYLERTS